MVEIEVLAIEFMPAILAGVVIALEDIMPGEFHFLFRHPIEKEEQDHLGHTDLERDGADNVLTFITARKTEPLVEGHRLERAAIGLHHLSMALIKEHEGPFNATDVDGLPETIEHEDVLAQDRFHGSLSASRSK